MIKVKYYDIEENNFKNFYALLKFQFNENEITLGITQINYDEVKKFNESIKNNTSYTINFFEYDSYQNIIYKENKIILTKGNMFGQLIVKFNINENIKKTFDELERLGQCIKNNIPY